MTISSAAISISPRMSRPDFISFLIGSLIRTKISLLIQEIEGSGKGRQGNAGAGIQMHLIDAKTMTLAMIGKQSRSCCRLRR